jgi:nuclear RNA export factor
LQGRIARQRANPLGNRPAGRGKKAAVNVNDGLRAGNTASVLKSISSSKAQGGGRIPGGGGIIFSGNDMPKTQNVVSLIKRFLESRWNAQAKFLNLEVRFCPLFIGSFTLLSDRIADSFHSS